MSHIQKIIDYFFHHEHSDRMVERVHQRLSSPGDEREKEEALRGLWEEIGLPAADRRSHKAFDRLETTLGNRRRIGIPAWLRIAAIWLIPLLSVGVSYYFYQASRDPDTIALMEQFVSAGKREQVTLPDGSRVWLNSGTLLLYPSAFTGDKREIYLVGEGYFKVSKQPEKPFVVRTKSMRVEVLGTEFNLSAYPDREKITTTLETGSIKILPDDPAIHPLVLKPDEQLEYIPSTGKTVVSHVTATDYSDWKEGGLFFTNDSFEDILNTLERTYNVKVHLRTSAYHTNHLTIHFNKNESLENVLMLIKEMVPGLEYQIKEEGVYID